MQLRRPSPAMVIACIALFVALGGTSIAAVNYARKAGAVDGRSAVPAGATLDRAAGKLVATAKTGSLRGKIPGKFLGGVPAASTFGQAYEVVDGATGAANRIGGAGGLGEVQASCIDENPRPAVEDPLTTVNFVNQSGDFVNVFRRVGVGEHVVAPQANGTVAGLTIRGSNNFRFHVERKGVNLLVDGVVRQDGRGTANASCLVYGTVLRVG